MLRLSFDGAHPAVLVPLGDFFGYAWGQPATRSLLVGTTGETNYCCLPMPFDRGATLENARRKRRLKHGGDLHRTSLTGLDVAQNTPDEQLLAVDEALDRFAAVDPVGARLVKLRFFVGLPNVEAARLLGIPERTAKRTWAYARAWLHEELKKAT